jgi:hypothetical protein
MEKGSTYSINSPPYPLSLEEMGNKRIDFILSRRDGKSYFAIVNQALKNLAKIILSLERGKTIPLKTINLD